MEKADIFAKDMGFSCYKCVDNCCYFEEIEYYIKEVGIYEEDLNKLQDNGLVAIFRFYIHE